MKSDVINSSNNNYFAGSYYRIAAICLLTPGFGQLSSLILILRFKF